MLRVNWLPFVAAIGLVLSGPVCAQSLSRNSGYPGTAQGQTKPQADAPPAIPVAVQNDIQRIAGALEAANGKPPSRTDERNATAQENVAEWAPYLFWLAAIETFVTSAGVILLALTLRYTKRTADAADGAVRETRRIGEAQVSAYLNIRDASVTVLQDWGGPENECPQIVINAGNTGQSPARKFIWRPTLRYYRGNQRRTRNIGITWVGAPGIEIATGSNAEDSLIFPDMMLNQFSASAAGPPGGQIVVHLRIEFEFENVFGTRISDTAYFIGTASTHNTVYGPKYVNFRCNAHPPIKDWDAAAESVQDQ